MIHQFFKQNILCSCSRGPSSTYVCVCMCVCYLLPYFCTTHTNIFTKNMEEDNKKKYRMKMSSQYLVLFHEHRKLFKIQSVPVIILNGMALSLKNICGYPSGQL